jgi:ABC-type sugar transport system ATPase subunit
MTTVAIEGLNKFFGDVKAVVDLNLSIDDGECLCLLGPSGCGKSTTLHCLAGLEIPTSGTIRFGDAVVNGLPPRARNVGLVFQSYALFQHMTVFENIAFGLQVQKEPKEAIRSEVDRMAALLDLSHLLHVKAGRISLSDMQRVALARTLITDPALLILDEPLSNLDATIRHTMRAELKRLQRELGKTLIYVTHDQLEAMSLADRIAIMDLGLLQQVGSPEEVYYHPVNLFVGGFIGNPPMNFIHGDYRNGEEGPTFGHPDFNLPISSDHFTAQGVTSQKIVLGIRPEAVELTESTNGNGCLLGQVLLAERLGRRSLVSVRIGEDVLRIEAPQNANPSIGENIGLQFRPEGVRLFDAVTGKSLSPSSGSL